jgi:hypothetical protein
MMSSRSDGQIRQLSCNSQFQANSLRRACLAVYRCVSDRLLQSSEPSQVDQCSASHLITKLLPQADRQH